MLSYAQEYISSPRKRVILARLSASAVLPFCIRQNNSSKWVEGCRILQGLVHSLSGTVDPSLASRYYREVEMTWFVATGNDLTLDRVWRADRLCSRRYQLKGLAGTNSQEGSENAGITIERKIELTYNSRRSAVYAAV